MITVSSEPFCNWACQLEPWLAPFVYTICFVAVTISALWALEQTRNDR